MPVLKGRVQTPAESFRATIALKLPVGRALSLAEINLTASVTVTASASIWIPRTSSSRIATAMHTPEKAGVVGLIWVGEQLVQLEPACNQRCQRHVSETLRHTGLGNAGVAKCILQIVFPDDPGPDYPMTNAMMDAPVKVVNEPPITALIDANRIELPVTIEPEECLGPSVQCDSIVVQVVDSEFEILSEFQKQSLVVEKFWRLYVMRALLHLPVRWPTDSDLGYALPVSYVAKRGIRPH